MIEDGDNVTITPDHDDFTVCQHFLWSYQSHISVVDAAICFQCLLDASIMHVDLLIFIWWESSVISFEETHCNSIFKCVFNFHASHVLCSIVYLSFPFSMYIRQKLYRKLQAVYALKHFLSWYVLFMSYTWIDIQN